MENTYSIYKFTFSDGKVYIGQTSGSVENRWKGGEGYKGQDVYAAIIRDGWDNVQKEILHENLPKEWATQIERYYMNKYNSIENGYNNTKINPKKLIKNLPAELRLKELENKIIEKLPILKSTSPNRLITFSELRTLATTNPELEVVYEYCSASTFLCTAKVAAKTRDVYGGGCGNYTFLFLTEWRVWIGNPDIKTILKTPWLETKDVIDYNSAFITDKKAKDYYLVNEDFPATFNRGFEDY